MDYQSTAREILVSQPEKSSHQINNAARANPSGKNDFKKV
jgi:hypothetical protein